MEEQIKALIENMRDSIATTESDLDIAKQEVVKLTEELKSKKKKLAKAENLLEGDN